jgi:hypothetical protein
LTTPNGIIPAPDTTTLHRARVIEIEPTETDCAYMAGLLDGEGSIRIRMHMQETKKIGRGYQIKTQASIHIANCDISVLKWAEDRFGGRISGRPALRERKTPLYDWSCSTQQAAQVLQQILPYLIIKREQANIYLEFMSTMKLYGYFGVPEEVFAKRLELINKIIPFHKKGKNRPQLSSIKPIHLVMECQNCFPTIFVES